MRGGADIARTAASSVLRGKTPLIASVCAPRICVASVWRRSRPREWRRVAGSGDAGSGTGVPNGERCCGAGAGSGRTPPTTPPTSTLLHARLRGKDVSTAATAWHRWSRARLPRSRVPPRRGAADARGLLGSHRHRSRRQVVAHARVAARRQHAQVVAMNDKLRSLRLRRFRVSQTRYSPTRLRRWRRSTPRLQALAMRAPRMKATLPLPHDRARARLAARPSAATTASRPAAPTGPTRLAVRRRAVRRAPGRAAHSTRRDPRGPAAAWLPDGPALHPSRPHGAAPADKDGALFMVAAATARRRGSRVRRVRLPGGRRPARCVRTWSHAAVATCCRRWSPRVLGVRPACRRRWRAGSGDRARRTLYAGIGAMPAEARATAWSTARHASATGCVGAQGRDRQLPDRRPDDLELLAARRRRTAPARLGRRSVGTWRDERVPPACST